MEDIPKLMDGSILLPGQKNTRHLEQQNTASTASVNCHICGKEHKGDEKFIRFDQKLYCKSCFVCSSCERALDTNDRVYEKNGEIYCEKCRS